MAKTHKNVSDLVNASSDNKDFNDKLHSEISGKQMGKILFALRCHRGFSQSEMASLMECSQSRVSKIEHNYDANITLGDLTEFTQALGLSLTVSFHDNSNAVESVKYHALQIKRLLDELRNMAGSDTSMLDGVVKFYQEFVINIGVIFGSCAAKLPPQHRNAVMQINADPELIKPMQVSEFVQGSYRKEPVS